MDKKITADNGDISHHEEETEAIDFREKSEAAGSSQDRRKSAALNTVENPLQLKSLNDVVADARSFAESHGLPEHARLFGRAALVARNMSHFYAISELNDEERHTLQNEKDHKWQGPKMLWYSIGLCAVGAATQGWDQTGANGANLSFPKEFGIDNPGMDEWIVEIINSII